MPFFSVVIPSYNRSEFIVETVESVLTQTFDDFEVLIVDDGSTDDTRAVVEKHFKSDDRILYHYQENQERGAARNNGFRKAVGDFVVFLDSDDVMSPDHLKTLFNGIQAHPEANFLATKFKFITDDSTYRSEIVKFPEGWYDNSVFLRGNPLAANVCARKSNPDIELFEEDRQYSILEDWMFLVQNFAKDKIYIIDKITILMKDHENRSMRTDNMLIVDRNLKVTQWILENVPMEKKKQKILKGSSHLFCSVHSYADKRTKIALKYLFKSIAEFGIRGTSVMLFIKILLGYDLVQKIKS